MDAIASDTSLVFNLVARDQASPQLDAMKEKFSAAAAGIGAGVAGALGVGIAANLDMEAANDKLAAQLGVGPAEAAELAKVSASVYENAWGDSVETVNEAVRGVYQNIGNASTAEGGIQGLTTKALTLAETFDQEVGPTTAAVGQMIKTGLAKNADEAFDILTVGFQKGANKADDLLDTFGEYGTQFRKFGLDGKTATGLLSQGLKAGARDADIVADSIKEFSIRAIDGSETTADGFKAIGLNADEMAAKIGKGGASATGALDLTLDKLRAMKDPTEREAAAVALFGTQAEDLGAALFALDPSEAVKALGKVEGATDKASKAISDNPKAALEEFKRKAVGELAEIGGKFVTFAMDNQEIMKPLGITLAALAGTILLVKGGMMAWAAAQAIWTGVTTVATGAQWLWNAALNANPISLIILAIVALVAAIIILWKKNETFRKIVTAVWNAVWGAIKKVGAWFKNTLWPWIRGVWDNISSGAGKMKNKVVGWWNKLIGFVTGVPGRIRKAASSMWDGIKNSFRSAINWLIGKWNGLSFGIPSITVFGHKFGGGRFRVPQIPYLAKGGTIDRAGMAVVGERGPELLHLPTGAAVSPLTRNGTGGEVRVVIQVDGADGEMKKLIRKMVRVDGRGDVQVAFGSR